MKNTWYLKVVVAAVLTTVVFSLYAQGAVAGKGNLKIAVDGCPSDQGLVKIALVNSAEGYKDSSKALMTKAVPVRNGKAEYDFKGVPFGEYAVTVYHDANGNNQLDKSIFGKPLEAYGFSNNARGIIGRPDYKKAVFTLEKAEMTMAISVE